MNPILVELIKKHLPDIDANKFENLVYDSLSAGVFDDLMYVFDEVGLSSGLTSITEPPSTQRI